MGKTVGFEALYNVRDLGGTRAAGGVVRDGLLFRGDQPFSATDADKRKLADLGVRKCVDFRSVLEHEDKPDPEIPGVENVYLPVIEDVRTGITHGGQENARIIEMLTSGEGVDPAFVDAYMCNMYRQFVSDPFSNAQYARFIDEVLAAAQAGEGAFWHCTAGKDRAGFATVILLEALGVDRADIVADYLQTNESLSGFVAGMIARFGDQVPEGPAREALLHFFYADEAYLDAAYDEAERTYGSFDAFLEQAIGIDEPKKAALRNSLLV